VTLLPGIWCKIFDLRGGGGWQPIEDIPEVLERIDVPAAASLNDRVDQGAAITRSQLKKRVPGSPKLSSFFADHLTDVACDDQKGTFEVTFQSRQGFFRCRAEVTDSFDDLLQYRRIAGGHLLLLAS
jgi:hypothetical protein